MASEKTDELYRELTEKGYPKDLCSGNCLQLSEYGLYSNAYAGLSVSDERATGGRGCGG